MIKSTRREMNAIVGSLTPDATREQKAVANRELHNTLCTSATTSLPTKALSWCHVHETQCPLAPRAAVQRFVEELHPEDLVSDSHASRKPWHRDEKVLEAIDDGALLIHHGSTMCSGWSPKGNFDGFAHKTERSHACWTGERIARDEQGEQDVWFHENRPEYPYQKQLVDRLPTQEIISIRVQSRDYQRGMSRTRRFTSGWPRRRFRWGGHDDAQLEFHSIFNGTQIDGHCFLTASDAAIEACRVVSRQIARELLSGSLGDLNGG